MIFGNHSQVEITMTTEKFCTIPSYGCEDMCLYINRCYHKYSHHGGPNIATLVGYGSMTMTLIHSDGPFKEIGLHLTDGSTKPWWWIEDGESADFFPPKNCIECQISFFLEWTNLWMKN